MQQNQKTNWTVVMLTIGSGVLASAAIGKAPPSLDLLREEFALSLVYAGWIVSIFSALACSSGVGFGIVADRFEPRSILLAGLWLQVCAGILAVLTASPLALLITRLLEGAGFLAVAVAAPGIIVAASSPRNRSWSLGLWSIYVPTGVSMAMVTAAIFLGTIGWRGLWLVFVALSALFAIAGHWKLPHIVRSQPNKAVAVNPLPLLRRPGPWLLALSFTSYTLMWISIMAWLPTYLIEQRGVDVGSASLLTALMISFNVPGNLIGTWLLHRQWRGGSIVALSAIIMGLSIYYVFDDQTSDFLRFVSCLIFSCSGGLLPAATLGTSRLHAPDPQRIGMINGIIIQGSHLGQLLGPPMLALVVTTQGSWESAQWLMVGFAITALVLGAGLYRLEKTLISRD
ncbi:MAG: MFS transporter [Gammaproteobacteria bacterium]|nr:MFS transporter [Gammaproteobacteria bacterium]